MARIALPPDQDHFLYVMNKVGSPRLNKRLNDGWDAQYFNDSTVTPREREAARIRMAHHVGCASCIAFRAAHDLPAFSDQEIPEELYENIFNYRSWPGYTERERLIIEFAERYSDDYRGMVEDEELWTRLRASFSEVELADLCLLCGTWESATRMYHLLVGIDVACAVPAVAK
jgi:alkylhydroperoxidase family enzyme